MVGLLSSLIWRGISETMVARHDIKRFEGKKNVLVALAPDRTHPAMMEASRLYENWDDKDWAFVKEDYPEGALHERFQCPPQEFRLYLVNRDGEVRGESWVALPLPEIYNRIKQDNNEVIAGPS
ncbi:MAG TPA: hypothetical protein VE954_24495 [Oligoflexus sp.]|uniref:hypothetical protein n=1 Tax=Oligoflexus sp. TaxID=1971216 RepID=UPI002D463E5C|nr:hypothetical protein [Oligoflexus sp.]HYX36276.1 hypothetical protein [Oligoflexus sp.]